MSATLSTNTPLTPILQIRYFSESTAGINYRQDDILAFIQKISRSSAPNPTAGIVYCRAKKTCDELAHFLRGQGIMAAAYHRCVKSRARVGCC